MLDAAALEKKGIHTVTVAWDNFEKAARLAARVQKVPNLALAIMPHRKGGDTEDDQRAKARALAPEVVRLLLAG
ncbi:MAG: hypothetical protein AB7E83_08430 [Ramlibacter sp.]